MLAGAAWGGRLSRRAFARGCAVALGASFAAPLGGCGTTAPAPPKAPPLPPLHVASLADLLPAPGLVWAVRALPRAIAQVPWLIPAIGAFAPEDRLDRFLQATGIDLRQVTEAWFAVYDLGRGETSVQLFRHGVDPAQLERRFRERLSTNVDRVVDREDVVRLGGGIGPERHVFARLGRDLVLFEQGATVRRGLGALLAARARGELADVAGIERAEPLGSLLRRFGDAPIVALAPGPVDSLLPGSAARSELSDLLMVSTGLGVSLRPTAREGIGLAVAVTGALDGRAAEASEVLKRAWSSLQRSEIGQMLALDHEKDPPLATHSDDTAALTVEVPAGSFAEGLRKVTDLDLRALLE